MVVPERRPHARRSRMMLNLIDALGTFENPVAQLVVVMGIAALAGSRLPARLGGRDPLVTPELPV
jgi:hypothetical protein